MINIRLKRNPNAEGGYQVFDGEGNDITQFFLARQITIEAAPMKPIRVVMDLIVDEIDVEAGEEDVTVRSLADLPFPWKAVVESGDGDPK